MNVATMRWVDRWLGAPICWLLTRWRKLFDRRKPKAPAKPKSILFIKMAEQGSTVLSQGALHAAIDRVGRKNVYFLVFAENRPILDLLDLIPTENVIAINTKGLLNTIWGALQAIVRMRRAKIDAVIDMEFFARASAALGYLSGARWRVGLHAFSGEAAYRGDLMTHRVSFNPYLHTSQMFQVLAEALDQSAEAFPTFAQTPPSLEEPPGVFRPTSSEVFNMTDLLARIAGWKPGRGLILLNANASDLMPLRRWPGDRYVELARRLLDRHPGVTIGFTGAPSEAAAVRNLVGQVGSPRCINLAGETSLRELLTIYTLADVLVTNDSGPAHFATLTAIDVVVLFGPETPKLFAAVSPRTHALWAGLTCSPCISAYNDRLSACRDNACMKHLTVDSVLAETMQCYERRRAQRRAA